uniref:(northern house mosquito) hypothetical protein n=1 Tax=Culex pipiens TaxID=7175 RepID=A0A8D8CT03_CULPI
MSPNLLPPPTYRCHRPAAGDTPRAWGHPGRLYAVPGLYGPASGSAAGSGTRQVRRRRGPLSQHWQPALSGREIWGSFGMVLRGEGDGPAGHGIRESVRREAFVV